MAVALDASSESHTGTTGDTSSASFTWTHTPVGTPKGILIFTFVSNTSNNDALSVTYGGINIPTISGGRAVDTATEPGDCKAWFLGTLIPTGAKSVIVNRTNNTDEMYAVCITVTANADTHAIGVILLQEDQAPAEQSVNDNFPGTNSLRFAGMHYGGSGVPVTGANSTALQNIDFGLHTIGVVRETTAGQGSRLVGFTNVSDDVAGVHLAITEDPGIILNNYQAVKSASAGIISVTERIR